MEAKHKTHKRKYASASAQPATKSTRIEEEDDSSNESIDKDIFDKTPSSDSESEEESMILSPHSDIDRGIAKRPRKQEHTSQRQTRKKMKTSHETDLEDTIARKHHQVPILSEPSNPSCDQTVICTPREIHTQFLAGLNVPVKRALLSVAGLPGCDQSKSLMTMLSQVVTNAREPPMAPLSFLDASEGMPYCELAATVSQHKQPIYAEATKNTCYLYAMEFSINENYLRHHQRIEKFDNSTSNVGLFEDKDLDSHFSLIFQRLSDNHSLQHSEQKANASALAEINIWDIRMSRSIFHFLPALWGHLDRSYLWLFLDLESLDHDKSTLHQLPSIPENQCYKDKNDRELIMRYHPNLHYFLHYVMLVKSRSKKDRQNVCSLFAMHNTGNFENIDEVMGHIMDTAGQMGVKTSIKERATLLHRKEGDVEILNRELDSLVDSLESSEEIPLSFVFLRSLFYEQQRIYITKNELQSKGYELGMSDDDLNDFRKFFMSSGSIIDVSKIDKTSPYVIVKPMRFTKELDNIFYPQSDVDSQITGYGLVTEEKAKAIFDHEYQFFMDVLVSVDLAIKLKGNQIEFEGTLLPHDNTYYYMPDVRVEPPDLICDPSALHLLLDINCPLRHLQVLFTKVYIANCKQSALVLKRNTPVNVTNFRTELSDCKSQVHFQLRYLGDTIEIHLPKSGPLADKNTCGDIVRACNKMMLNDSWLKSKYAFAMMCFEHKIVTDANHLHPVCHILPHDTHCKSCKENGRANKFLELWNEAIRQNRIIPPWRVKETPVKVTLSENPKVKELSPYKRIKVSEQENKSLSDQLKMTQSELEKLGKKVKRLESKNTDLLQENTMLKKENEKLADIQSELADTQSKLEELKKKYEALEHEVENLRKAKDNILKKSPEVDDVFHLIKEHSANWNDLAIALKIDENTRTSLHNDGRLTDDGRLDKILQKWHQAQPSDVTWEKILEVLESMKLIRTRKEVKKFLEKPNVIEKYRKKSDF